jgi:hypothetical protein
MTVSDRSVKDRVHYQPACSARDSLVLNTTVDLRTFAYLKLRRPMQGAMAHLRHLIRLSATKALYE